MGAEGFAAAWEAGRAMTLEQAIIEAVDSRQLEEGLGGGRWC